MKRIISIVLGIFICIYGTHIYYQIKYNSSRNKLLPGTIITSMSDDATDEKYWIFLNPNDFKDYIKIRKDILSNKTNIIVQGIYIYKDVLYFWGIDRETENTIRIGRFYKNDFVLLGQPILCDEYLIPYCRFLIQNNQIFFSYNNQVFLLPMNLTSAKIIITDKSRESSLLSYHEGILYTAENQGEKKLMFSDGYKNELVQALPYRDILEGWFNQEEKQILINSGSNKSKALSLLSGETIEVQDYPIHLYGNQGNILLAQRLPIGSGGATILDNNFSLKTWIGGIENLEVYRYGLYNSVTKSVRNFPVSFGSDTTNWSYDDYKKDKLMRLKKQIET